MDITKVPTGWVRFTIKANAGGQTLTFNVRCDDFYGGDDGSLVLRVKDEMVCLIEAGWREGGLQMPEGM